MSYGGILIFIYDGSAEGFFSAVFDAFSMKVLPDEVIPEGEEQPSLLKTHYVETNLEHSSRVRKGIAKKLGGYTLSMIEKALLFDGEGKETAIMRFVWKAFKEGRSTGGKIADEEVNRVFRMCVAVGNEAERFRQCTRFNDVNGALVAEIHPKHYVLPLIKPFFCARIKNEHFMIFDSEHGAALIHSPEKTAIIPVENLEIPSDAEDGFYSNLWKSYYRHIAIASRYNPTCRRAHMPKRFWRYLPEMEEELSPGYREKLSLGTTAEIAKGLRTEKLMLNG